ncbi:GAF domain-containing protein, partial [Candidatus Bathyarchaeota archaeon]|nr:GAF domain-containing protein [Candidatus Bathyarchaeota archaeon]
MEDDPFFRYFVKTGIEKADPSIHVETVSTAEEALKIFDGYFDCIISDYILPYMNGIELLEKVREKSDIAFILYTGYGSEEIATEAFLAGVDDYIKKDSDAAHITVFANRIRQVAEQNRIKKINNIILNESEEGIIVLVDGKIKFANHKILELSGFKIEDVIDQELTSFISPDFREITQKILKENIDSDKPVYMRELKVILKNGKKIIVDLKGINRLYHGKKSLFIFINEVTPKTRYKNQLEILHAYSTRIRLAENIADIANLTLTFIKNIIEFNTAYFFLIEDTKFIPIAKSGVRIEELENPWDVKGVCLEALRKKQTIRSIGQSLLSENQIMLQQIIMEIAIPIIINNEVYAIINIESQKILENDSEETRLLEILGMHVTHALIGLESKVGIKKFEKKLASLHECAIELYKANDVEEIGEKALDSMQEALGFGQASFGIVRDDKIYFIRRRGFVRDGGFHLPLNGPGITVRAVKTGETQHISDVRDDKDYVAGPSTESLALLSELAVPVKIDGKVVAVLNAESQRVKAFSDSDRKLVEILAMHVASSIRQLNVRELEKMRNVRLEAILKHAVELEKAVNIEEVAAATINIINHIIGLGVASFAIVEDGKLKFLRIEGYENFEPELLLSGPGVTVRAVRTGETQVVKDTREDKDYVSDLQGKAVYLSELAVPVKICS